MVPYGEFTSVLLLSFPLRELMYFVRMNLNVRVFWAIFKDFKYFEKLRLDKQNIDIMGKFIFMLFWGGVSKKIFIFQVFWTICFVYIIILGILKCRYKKKHRQITSRWGLIHIEFLFQMFRISSFVIYNF